MVTIFKHFSEIDKPYYVSIDAVLDGIKNGKVKEQIDEIRSETDESKISSMKMKLPCVLFSGKFDIPVTKKRDNGTFYNSYRTDESLSQHSRFVCFDIDDVDIEKYKSEVHNDEYIYALWVSPSGTGLHGLIKIADGTKHESHYTALLKRYPVFDTTARNPSRVLFFSYDPDIYINENSKVFFDVAEKDIPSGTEISGTQTDYKRLGVAAKMIRIAEQGTRHNAVIKASYLVGGLISGGIVEEEIGRMVLEHEVRQKFDHSEVDVEIRAVNDGINAGRYMPISDIGKYEYEVMEAVGAIEDELSFLSNNRTDEDFIRKYRAGLIPMGKPFGYFDMDKFLMLKEGEFYATLSHSHTGKTTVNLWLIFLSALKYDWCWVIYTGENRIASVKMRIIEFYVGRKIREIPDDYFRQAMSWLNERFFFVNNEHMYEYKELLSYAESVSKYHAVKGLFIDPINSLKINSKNSKYDYDMQMYTDMLLFTKRTNISIFLSIHTRTQAQRERDSSGNQLMPFPADADGGAILYNKADIFVVMNRNIQDPQNWMVTELFVSKNRNSETGGGVTPRGDAIRIKMNRGLEFTDLGGELPFERDYLIEEEMIITSAKDEEIRNFLNDTKL